MTEDIQQDQWGLGSRVRACMLTMSRSERKIARLMLSTHFRAASATVAKVAERANVSGPTVLRFVNGLGFNSYRDFQHEAHREFEESVLSPYGIYSRKATPSTSHDVIQAAMPNITRSIDRTFKFMAGPEIERVVDLLADDRRPLYVAGGQFTSLFAGFFAARMFQIRDRVRSQGFISSAVSRNEELATLGKRDTVVVFDLRRYEEGTVTFAREAAHRGATVILVTDPWLSPIADFAHYVLVADVDAGWAYDSCVSFLALLEVLFAALLAKRGDLGAERIRMLEQFQKGLLDGAEFVTERED